MATIDSLDIRIGSDSSKASKSIDSLVGKLKNLNKGIQSLSTGGLRNYTRDVGRLSAAVKSLNSIKFSNSGLGGLSAQLDKLSRINFSNLSSAAQPLKDFAGALRAFNGLSNISIPSLDTRSINSIVNTLNKMQNIDTSKISQISGGLSRIANALSVFGNMNFRDNGINSTINALNRLLRVDFSKFSTRGMAKVVNSISALGKLPDVSSSVNRLINSLAKLANAGDRVRIVAAQLPSLSTALRRVVADLRSLGSVSDSTTAFVQAIAQLANAGDKAQKAADGMDDLRDGIIRLFEAMKDAPRISENTIRMTEALSRLANTGRRMNSSSSGASSAFNGLASSAERAANAVSGVATNVFSVTKGAFSKLSQVGASAAKNMLSATKGAFSKLSQVASKAASAVSNAAKTIASSFLRIGRSSGGINSATSSLKSLAKAAVGLGTVRGLYSFGKSAVGLGSDIAEVENVVDVAFGSMAGDAYDFASTAAEQFGLSELAAKRYSGTMMAMLKSSGVAQDQAAKMSTTLAGLAGDIASFYNLETDEAFYKLRAAIAGETEPMKALGVNMNIVNLEAYAMSQGITKAYRDMTLAEQSLLRYNYILAKTGDAQGDFSRTVGSFANQWRLLKLNIQSVAAVIGQGLIAVLTPAIQLLNKFMAKIMQAAKAFRNFMYVLTGKKLSGSQKGIVNDFAGIADYTTDLSGIGDIADDGMDDVADDAEDAADGVDNVADSMETATDNAKKLEKALSVLSFDELHQLSKNPEPLGDSTGEQSNKNKGTDKNKDKLDNLEDIGLGTDDAIFDDLFGKEEFEPVNKWAAALRKAFLDHDWEGLGKIIADMINIGLRRIYDAIKAITPKVEDAMRALARVINSLVDNLDWDLLGRTIGAGINLIVKAFNALVGPGGIDFENLGRKLSVGVRGLVDEVEWRELGNAIGNGFMIAWRIADGFIEDMWRVGEKTLLTGWAELGNAIGDTIVGIFEMINFEQIARVLTEGFKGILETATYALNRLSDNLDWIVDKINLGLKRLYDGLKWDSEAGENMGQKITAFTDAVVRAFNKLLNLDFGLIGRIIGAAMTDIVRAFNQLTGPGGLDFERLGNNIAEGFRGLLDEVPWVEFGNALGNGFMAAWDILNGFITEMSTRDNYGMTGWKELGQAVADSVAGIFQSINFGEIGTGLAKAFNGIFDSLREFTETMEKNGTWTKIANNISRGLNNAIRGIRAEEAGKTLSKFVTDLLDMLLDVAEKTHWDELGKKIGVFLSSIKWGDIFGKIFDIIKEVVGGLISGFAETSAGKLAIALGAAFGGIKLTGVGLKIINPIVKELTDKGIATHVVEAIGKAFSGVTGLFTEGGAIFDALSGGASMLGGAFEGLTGIALPTGAAMAGIVAAIVAVVAAIVDLWKTSETFRDAVKDAFGKVKEHVVDAFSKIEDAIGPLWESIKELGDTLYDFYENSGLKDIVELIATLAASLIGTGLSLLIDNIATAFAGFAKVLGGAIEVISGVFEILEGIFTLDFEKVVEGFGKVGEGIYNAFSGIVETFAGIGGNIIEGLFSGISDAIGVIGEWLKEHVVDPIVEGVKSLFGIHSPSTVFAEIGGFLMAGLLEGLGESVGSVLEWFAGLPGWIKEKIGDAKEWLKEKGKNAIEGLRNGWDSVKESEIGQAAQELGGYLKEKAGNAQDWIKEKGSQAIEGLRNGWDALKESRVGQAAQELGSYVKERAGDAHDWIKEKGSSAIEGLRNGWDSVKESEFGQAVQDLGNYAKEKAGDAKGWIDEKGSEAIEGLRSGWDSAKDSKFGQEVQGLGAYIQDKAGDAKGWLEQKGSDIIEGMRNGFDGNWGSFGNVLSSLGDKIRNALPDLTSVGSNMIRGLANGIRSINIPLPHIEIGWNQHQIGDASFSTPSFGVKWYAKGGMFDSASVIGVGEAGREAVLPLENKRTMAMLSNAITSEMDFGLGGIRDNPFLENIALYTQQTANWCSNINDILMGQGDTMSMIDESLKGLLENSTNNAPILEAIKTQVEATPAEEDARIEKLSQTITQTTEIIVENITDIVGAAIESLNNSIQTTYENVKTGIDSLVMSINTGAQTLGNLVAQSAQNIINSTNSGFNLLNNSMSQSAQPVVNSINTGFNLLNGSVNKAAQTLSNSINSGLSQLKSSISSLSSKISSSNTRASKASTKASSGGATKAASNAVSNATANANAKGANSPKTANTKKSKGEYSKKVKEVERNAKEELSYWTQRIKSTLPKADWSIRIKQETDRINKGKKQELAELKKIYGLKTGGLVVSPMLTQIGEMSRPEAVLPLTDSRAMSMISESITSHMPANGTFEKGDLIDAIVEGVVMAMMNNPQSNRFPEYIQNSIYLDRDVIARAVSKSNNERDYRFSPA